ncbi:MAG: MFS transporter [Parvularculaceae bacterium]
MRQAHLALFFAVFIDLLGLGILAPLIPFYVANLGVSPEIITLVIATYSLCQFIGAPIWSGISDRIGRRPVLLISMAGHALAYLILANADSIWLLLLSRAIGGFTSANLATAYAYVADTTTDDDRAATMGRISAAFGLGFIIGPVFGGFLAGGGDIDSVNYARPALAAMALSLVSFVSIYFMVPETAPLSERTKTNARRNFFADLGRISGKPVVSKAIILCLITVVFIAGREAIFPLWLDAKHSLSINQVALVISVGALTLTIFQLTMIGRVTRMFGETNLIRAATVLFAICWLGLAFSQSIYQIIAASIVGSIALAIFQTSLQSLLSKRAEAGERGAVMGIYQATNSLGRFGGQAVSGTIYGKVGIDGLFLIGAVMMIPAFILATVIARGVARNIRDNKPEPGEDAYVEAKLNQPAE